jgi:DNA polymerase III epsilon subunit-like protein
LLSYGNLDNLSAQPHIIQMGMVLCDDDGKIKAQFDTLIKPNSEWTSIPKVVSDINGIKYEDCVKYGITIKNALAILNQYLKLKPLVIGHNIKGFDLPLLRVECARIETDYIAKGLKRFDTMHGSLKFCSIPKAKGNGLKNPKLIELHQKLFGCEFDGAHSAIEDIRATIRCYFELKRLGVISKDGIEDIEE